MPRVSPSRPSARSWRSAAWVAIATASSFVVIGTLATSISGCGAESAGDDACQSDREYFAQKVWGPVMGQYCIKCHTPDGSAAQQNALLKLMPSSYPGFLDHNLKHVAEVSKYAYDGKSIMIAKPTAAVAHGGGQVIKPGSKEHDALIEMVERLKNPSTCGGAGDAKLGDEIKLMSPLDTLRKATVHLAGRLPTASEIKDVKAGGEAALKIAVAKVLEEPAFYKRLMEMYNDLLLTDRYNRYNTAALYTLNNALWPMAQKVREGPAADRGKYNYGVAREPLELIAYVVKNNKPFTDVLTADYTVFNPFSAKLYNAKVSFKNASDAYEFKPGKISYASGGKTIAAPHAGVLTSPMFLNRFPTTRTNRNRHRARVVFDLFLGTNILAIAERPIDPTKATAYANPTREDPTCNVCHKLIDPLAGAFQKYSDYDYERYEPARKWYTDMYPPGFGNERMGVVDFNNALPWLAKRIVGDPRFVIATVNNMFLAVIGEKPLAYPRDHKAKDFAGRLAAWQAQDVELRRIGKRFADQRYNLKVVITELVLGTYFRALIGDAKPAANSPANYGPLGSGRLLTPEMLDRKIEAVFGLRWANTYNKVSYLLSDYVIPYGGIDSDRITKRLTVPNGVMANVSVRMANEIACGLVANDFARAQKDRVVAPKVTLKDLPADVAGAKAIKENLRYLHERLLGEDLAVDHAEIARSFKLFKETQEAGVAAVTAKKESSWLTWSCQGRTDLATGRALATAQQVRQDPTYTARAWRAVVTYLLLNYEFLHE